MINSDYLATYIIKGDVMIKYILSEKEIVSVDEIFRKIESQNFMDKIIELNANGVLSKDLQQEIVSLNNSWCISYNNEINELVGSGLKFKLKRIINVYNKSNNNQSLNIYYCY